MDFEMTPSMMPLMMMMEGEDAFLINVRVSESVILRT